MTSVQPANNSLNPIYATCAQDIEAPLLQRIFDVVSAIFTATAYYFIHGLTFGLFLAEHEARVINLRDTAEALKNQAAELNQLIESLSSYEAPLTIFDEATQRSTEIDEKNEIFEQKTKEAITAPQLSFSEALSVHKLQIFCHFISLGLYSGIKGAIQAQEIEHLEQQICHLEIERQALIAKGYSRFEEVNRQQCQNINDIIVLRKQELEGNQELKKLDDDRFNNKALRDTWAFQSKTQEEKLKATQKRFEASLRTFDEKYYLFLLGSEEPIFKEKFEDPKKIEGDTFKANSPHFLRYNECKHSVDLYDRAAKYAFNEMKHMEKISTYTYIDTPTICSFMAYDLISGASLENDCNFVPFLSINPNLTVKDFSKSTVIDNSKDDLTTVNADVDPWTPYGEHKAVYPVTAKRMLERLTLEERKLMLDTLLFSLYQKEEQIKIQNKFDRLGMNKQMEITRIRDLIKDVGMSLYEKANDIINKARTS